MGSDELDGGYDVVVVLQEPRPTLRADEVRDRDQPGLAAFRGRCCDRRMVLAAGQDRGISLRALHWQPLISTDGLLTRCPRRNLQLIRMSKTRSRKPRARAIDSGGRRGRILARGPRAWRLRLFQEMIAGQGCRSVVALEIGMTGAVRPPVAVPHGSDAAVYRRAAESSVE